MKQHTRLVISSLLTIPLMLLTSGVAAAQTAVSLKDLASTHVSATATAAARPANFVAGESPRRTCSRTVPNPHVPNAAFSVFAWLLKHNYTPPRGLRGNSVYQNSNHKLPDPPAGYRWFEYRVYKGAATAQRIVTARNFKAVGNKYPYYTPDHYETFKAMFLCSS